MFDKNGKNLNSENNVDESKTTANGYTDSQQKYTKKQRKDLNYYIMKSPIAVEIIVLIFTSIIRAIAINMFAVPNKLSLGGVTGLTSIFYNALGWNVALMNFLLNAPLLVLAFIYINKKFAISTLFSTILTSLAIEYLNFMPVFTDDIFVAALISGALTGIAISLLLKINSSSGGTDIVGVLVQNKFPDAKIVWIIFILNAIISIITGIVFKSLPLVIYSFISVFTSSYAGDLVQRGFVSTFEIKIITKKPNEISNYVINVLKRSATLMQATGMYTGENLTYLVCIVRKRQVNELVQVIKKTDPEAFFYITSVHDTIGKGFDNTVAPGSKL